jgi:diaminohydroxyphosphoribosylaminopyrimidine deaminase/5-amino-6-(5-phosphoribosylamino)uracil reductase
MHQIKQYEAAMSRALELALNGPAYGVNPQVGAVLIDDQGQILAEGWHRGAGTDHAEVDALKNLATAGISPQGLTAVVTLEPCNHTGRTGPCSQALVNAGVAKVVFAVGDPSDAASGGAETLNAAGIATLSGILEIQAKDQNRVWLTSTKLGRPFVTLKWAETLDGRNAAEDGTSKWISGPESRVDAHLRRSQIDAILVGTQTVLMDDPELTARRPDGSLYEHQPLRVVIGETELPGDARIFNDGAETIHFKTRSIHGVLSALHERGIRHVLVEGGAKVASNFIKLDLVDEYLTYLAPMLLGGARTAMTNLGIETMGDAKHLSFKEVLPLGADLLIRSSPVATGESRIASPTQPDQRSI